MSEAGVGDFGVVQVQKDELGMPAQVSQFRITDVSARQLEPAELGQAVQVPRALPR